MTKPFLANFFQAKLARAFKRPAGMNDLGADEQRAVESLGLRQPETQAKLVRAFHRPGGYGELGAEDKKVLAAAGIKGKEALAAFERLFRRPGGYGDLGADDKKRLAKVRSTSHCLCTCKSILVQLDSGLSQHLAAMGEMSSRPCCLQLPCNACMCCSSPRKDSIHLKASSEPQTCYAKAGFDVENPRAVNAVARFFRRGAGGELSEEEANAAALAGVDVAAHPLAPGALARAFRRPGGYAELGGDERAALAAAGVDLANPSQVCVHVCSDIVKIWEVGASF